MNIRMMLVLVFVFAAAMLFAQLGSTPTGDSRVKKVLDDLGYTYEVDADGDYRLLFNYEDGRSQLVWIRSNTNQYENLEIREIFSYGYETSGKMSADVARNLLAKNSEYKIGAWELLDSNSKQYGLFTARISATVDSKTMQVVLRAVGVTADEMEKDLLGSDDW